MTNVSQTAARLLDGAGGIIKKYEELYRETGQEAARLLDGAGGIIKKYDEIYRKTGLKYNIFRVARISEKEVLMCRVIADLLDPKGCHCKGSLYLKLFWDRIAPKLEGCPPLDCDAARVSTEYPTDAERRIDIVIESGEIFIPIEVKIWAGDQEKQVADYAEFARTKNGNIHIPVLYLTRDGHAPENAEEKDYICLSFEKDIIAWLKMCQEQDETKTTPSVQEIIRQLVQAIKIFCGKQEDEEMENEIRELVMRSDESVRAALAISRFVTGGAAAFQWKMAYDEFMGPILELVKKSFPGARKEEGKTWSGIYVPVKEGKYLLFVNYDWEFFQIDFGENRTPNPKLEKALAKKMSEITGLSNNSEGGDAWIHNGIKHPDLSSVDDDIYFYRLYLVYKEHPQETADRIIAMAQALETV
ncbi:MAG: PD-(D/E)XK nuclease family protein [Spirochaetales bacterium]|jgi:hypothetical protein|nr:PD-(D/E)XK nuclease family protein [Spirochaetales bacterium]